MTKNPQTNESNMNKDKTIEQTKRVDITGETTCWMEYPRKICPKIIE